VFVKPATPYISVLTPCHQLNIVSSWKRYFQHLVDTTWQLGVDLEQWHKPLRKAHRMPNIGEYTDYRKFLLDFYQEAKSRNPSFSYQMFSEKAGIKSKGFLYNVMRGKRDITKSNLFGLVQAMKLGKHETEYFENLVSFNQAKNLNERNHYYERLSAVRSSGKTAWKPQIIRQEQYEFYATWYHSVIRSLIDLHGFSGDYEWLAKSVYPRIRPLQAKKSVELLLKLGLVKKEKDGSYKVTDKSITTPKEVLSLAFANFHEQAGKLALDSLKGVATDKRDFSGMTLGISEETYREICEDIYMLRQKILQKAEADSKANAVYQLNFQLFPVSKTDMERKSL
jgi:uncharacterized protein (TIGR02147 family)